MDSEPIIGVQLQDAFHSDNLKRLLLATDFNNSRRYCRETQLSPPSSLRTAPSALGGGVSNSIGFCSGCKPTPDRNH